MFKTTDVEYKDLLKEILDDTAAHKMIIEEKLTHQHESVGN
jgi:hypothetical protein